LVIFPWATPAYSDKGCTVQPGYDVNVSGMEMPTLMIAALDLADQQAITDYASCFLKNDPAKYPLYVCQQNYNNCR